MTDTQTMHRPPGAVNLRRRPRVAQLRNVALATDAIGQAIDRIEPTIPSICVMYGYPGLGKTMALGYCLARFDGVAITASSLETPTEILRTIGRELGLSLPHSAPRARMLPLVIDELRRQERPLLVDEFDRIVQRSDPDRSIGLIELFRDLVDRARVPMLVAGEERLPYKLEKFTRFFDRVLAWVPAVPLDMGDAAELQRLYCPEIEVEPCALAHILERTQGNARRFTTMITGARQLLLDAGRGTLTEQIAHRLPTPVDTAPMARRFQ